MKKTELLEIGIPEEKIPGFRKAYWADVKKQAAIMVQQEREQETAPSPGAMREATAAMMRLIVDPVRLAFILDTVNKEYHYQQKEQMRKEYEQDLAELRQKIAQNKREGQQAKQLQEEGAAE